jgi:hypothetical protein
MIDAETLDRVIKEIADEIGCGPDNEVILWSIARLRTEAADHVREIERLRELLTHADNGIIWEQNFPIRSGFQEEVEDALGIGHEKQLTPMSELEPHAYAPSPIRMCAVCGNFQGAAIHSPSRRT